MCDDHCSWDLCRTTIPKNDCIDETSSVWKWDKLKNAWVAQLLEGIRDFINAKFWTISIIVLSFIYFRKI